MANVIQSISERWTFEIYDDKRDVKSTEPTIMLVTEPFPDGHNSKFPYVVLAIYYVDNPALLLNDSLPFTIKKNEIILLLKHDYNNAETQLTNALKLMIAEFETIGYGKNGKKL